MSSTRRHAGERVLGTWPRSGVSWRSLGQLQIRALDGERGDGIGGIGHEMLSWRWNLGEDAAQAGGFEAATR